jgi:hypothetical protein
LNDDETTRPVQESATASRRRRRGAAALRREEDSDGGEQGAPKFQETEKVIAVMEELKAGMWDLMETNNVLVKKVDSLETEVMGLREEVKELGRTKFWKYAKMKIESVELPEDEPRTPEKMKKKKSMDNARKEKKGVKFRGIEDTGMKEVAELMEETEVGLGEKADWGIVTEQVEHPEETNQKGAPTSRSSDDTIDTTPDKEENRNITHEQNRNIAYAEFERGVRETEEGWTPWETLGRRSPNSRKSWGNSRCVVPGERIVEIRNGMDGFQERRQYSFSKLPEATSNNQDHQGCLGREERRA